MIQSGSLGLVHACRKLDYDKLRESEDMERVLSAIIEKLDEIINEINS